MRGRGAPFGGGGGGGGGTVRYGRIYVILILFLLVAYLS